VSDLLVDLEAQLARLPLRWQSILLDRLLECVPGQSARALKNVSVNEPFFQGHFPDYPVMPGILVIEAMVQLSTLLCHASGQGLPDTIESLDGVRFKRQIVPGDQLILHTTMLGEGQFAGKAMVGDDLAAEAEFVLRTVARPG
jgi:3-hydroxyacyl-[acyl-carrier-protein] dehydratase